MSLLPMESKFGFSALTGKANRFNISGAAQFSSKYTTKTRSSIGDSSASFAPHASHGGKWLGHSCVLGADEAHPNSLLRKQLAVDDYIATDDIEVGAYSRALNWINNRVIMRHNSKTTKSTALGITKIDLNLKVPVISPAENIKDRQNNEASLKINDIDCNTVSPTVISIAIALGYTNSSNNISRGGVAQWDMGLDAETCSDFHNKSPTHDVELTSHLNCIAAHPEQSSVWSVGSTYGEVMIVDFTVNEGKDPVVACSKMSQYTHIQPIASVEWFRPDVDSEWTICSVGRDGRIIMWGSSLNYPMRCIPMNLSDVPIIITAMKVQQPTRLSFGNIGVGSAGGSVSVYEIGYSKKTAAMIPACEMKWSANALKILCHMQKEHREDAVKKIERRVEHKKRKGVDCLAVLDAKIAFDELFPSLPPKITERLHAGEVTCVAMNPFCPNVFLTGGSDGAVKLYVKSLHCCILWFNLPPTSAKNSFLQQRWIPRGRIPFW